MIQTDTVKQTKQDFLKLSDYTPQEIQQLLASAMLMKEKTKQGVKTPYLDGKVLGMIFEKSSTRTRVSFEVGMLQLGGHAIFLSKDDIQLGRGESNADTAKVLSRYVDGLMIRTYDQETLNEFAKMASIPVISGLSDLHHPVQVLADLLTIYEHKGAFAELKLAYLGDGANNMCHSLIEGCVLSGMDMAIGAPAGYQPAEQVLAPMKQIANENDTALDIYTDPKEAVIGADIIVTDTWTSMGMEAENAERLEIFAEYQVNSDLCALAKEDYVFMHCLPAHRGEEVTSEIIDGDHSIVFDEAENRLHAQKAILKQLLED